MTTSRTIPVSFAVTLIASMASANDVKNDPRVQNSLNLLEVWAEAEMAYADIPAVSMAVVHDQELLWSRAFGFADRERKAAASTDTLYSICSISKLFTAIGVLQLRDQGKLELDDPVSQHLPWFDIQQSFEGAPPPTVRGLLTHSAGLPRETDHSYWTYPEYSFPTREEIIDHLSDQKTLYPEGRYFQYSNLGLTLAGEILAQVSGEPYAEYSRRHILDPLGLSDTSTEIPVEHRGGRFAMGYGGKTRSGGREPLTFLQVKGVSPAAGYASTVLDLAKFASWQFRLLSTGREEVLKASTLREMQRVQWMDPDWKTSWGLGFSVSRSDEKTFVGHGGSCPGFRSDLLLQMTEKFASVSMANASDAAAAKFTRNAFRIVAPAIAESKAASQKASPPDPALERYVGTYASGWGGEIAVVPWKDGLGMLFLPTDNPMEALEVLKPSGENRFRRVRRDDGELAEEVVFTVENGKVTRFTRHNNHSPKIR
jgi:CubicO group peptidase (beta-lactamase class C family)